jgi:hypothetical protein
LLQTEPRVDSVRSCADKTQGQLQKTSRNRVFLRVFENAKSPLATFAATRSGTAGFAAAGSGSAGTGTTGPGWVAFWPAAAGGRSCSASGRGAMRRLRRESRRGLLPGGTGGSFSGRVEFSAGVSPGGSVGVGVEARGLEGRFRAGIAAGRLPRDAWPRIGTRRAARVRCLARRIETGVFRTRRGTDVKIGSGVRVRAEG